MTSFSTGCLAFLGVSLFVLMGATDMSKAFG